MSAVARSKILKPATVEPQPLELTVAQALFDVESHVNDLKADLRTLQFYAAQEHEVAGSRKVIVLQVPVNQLKVYRKISARLVRELEKKFSDKHVVIMGRRKIIAKPKRGTLSKPRPVSRTLTAVHESMLDDIVSPTEIVGKRTRVKQDGSHLLKVFLDPKDRNLVEYKLDTFAAIYRKLTGKTVSFEFAPNATD